MRYGVAPTKAVEWLAAALGKIPYPILDVLMGPMQARALSAAVQVGALDALATASQTPAELARRLGCDEECLRLVLRVLAAMGYVEAVHQKYTLTAMGRRYFGPDAAEPYSAFVKYGPPQWKMMDELDRVLRSGLGVDFHDHQTPHEWKLYQAAMLEHAKGFAWFVAEKMPVPHGATQCVDLAGSHGLVSAALCRKHPGLHATVIDRPEALAVARQLAAEAGHADLVSFREGDLSTDSFGTDVDVALLCNILHHFAADTNREILRRVYAALRRSGTVGIFDLETRAADAGPDAAPDALALYFRITSTSKCFLAADYLQWLGEAGFSSARVVRSVKMPSRMLLVATKVGSG